MHEFPEHPHCRVEWSRLSRLGFHERTLHCMNDELGDPLLNSPAAGPEPAPFQTERREGNSACSGGLENSPGKSQRGRQENTRTTEDKRRKYSNRKTRCLGVTRRESGILTVLPQPSGKQERTAMQTERKRAEAHAGGTVGGRTGQGGPCTPCWGVWLF